MQSGDSLRENKIDELWNKCAIFQSGCCSETWPESKTLAHMSLHPGLNAFKQRFISCGRDPNVNHWIILCRQILKGQTISCQNAEHFQRVSIGIFHYLWGWGWKSSSPSGKLIILFLNSITSNAANSLCCHSLFKERNAKLIPDTSSCPWIQNEWCSINQSFGSGKTTHSCPFRLAVDEKREMNGMSFVNTI